jgi:hypothetical protein
MVKSLIVVTECRYKKMTPPWFEPQPPCMRSQLPYHCTTVSLSMKTMVLIKLPILKALQIFV